MKKLFSMLLALCLLAGAICFAEEEAIPGMTTDIPYMDDGSTAHLLDLFVDPDATEAQPVILEIHGGGFFGGSKETNTAHCAVYQQAGFAVAAPNYTLMPESNFKTIVQELFTFLHWIGDNAETYNLDLNNAFISGDSAGGFLSLLTAAVLSSEDLQAYYEVTPPAYEIRGYALTCPVTDLPALADAMDNGSGFVAFMAKQMGEAVLKDEDSFNHADLYQIIDPTTFPEIYFLTTPTDANFHADSAKFDAFLTDIGVAHIYKVYEGTEGDLNHVFNVTDPTLADSQRANADIIDYFRSLMGAAAPAEGEEGYTTALEGYTTTVRWCANGDKKIYGELTLPDDYDGTQKYPTIIMSHGFMGSHSNFAVYIPMLATQGLALYTFDFRTGTANSRSDGDALDYSVATEMEDLNAVIDFVETLDCVDTERLMLWGESMGGVVTAFTAVQREESFPAVILFYPAFIIEDDIHGAYPTKEELPTEPADYRKLVVGPRFFSDVYDMDFMAEIAPYAGDVLMLHGTADVMVPISYAEAAAEVYQSVTFIPIEGANHGFPAMTKGETDYRPIACQLVLDYLAEKGIL